MAKEGAPAHKFLAEMIPLLELSTVEPVQVCGLNSDKLVHDAQGLRITDIGRGVLVEREGYPDTLIYPPMLKRGVALEDLQLAQKKFPTKYARVPLKKAAPPAK